MAAQTLDVWGLLAAGRMIASRKAPYFRAMITSMVPHETDQVPTIGITKGAVLVFNRAWCEKRTQDEMGALIWHEVMHLVLNHHGRRGDKDPYLYNVAGDMFINDQGKRTLSLQFPVGGWFPEIMGFPPNLSTEEYYGLLVQKGQEAAESAYGKAMAGKGDVWESGNCGSGAGNPVDGEPEAGTAGGDEVGARSDADVQQTRVRVAEAVKEHARQAQGRGNLPLGMDRWADEAVGVVKVPWQTVLARTVRRAVAFRPGAVDYSYSKISRRQGGVGFGVGCPVLPAFVRPVPIVSFVLDTSGSMSQEQLALAITEATGVLRACGAEMTFASCDTQVHAIGKVTHPAQLAKLVKGGGGSCFNDAFEVLARQRPRPQLVILATDGDIQVPSQPPPWMRVVWLLVDTPDSYLGQRPATWGDHIVVSTRAGARMGSAA